MSVRLFVRMEQLGSHLTDFHAIWYLMIFQKYVAKIKVSLKLDKKNGHFTLRLFYHISSVISHIISLSFLLRMRNVSDKSCRENENTHFVFCNLFRKSCCLWENVEKYCRAWQAKDDNMAHAHCMLDTCLSITSKQKKACCNRCAIVASWRMHQRMRCCMRWCTKRCIV